MNQNQASSLQFVKWGGSLITDKNSPSTPRLDRLAQLAGELAEYRRRRPESQVLLGHGSGSFGHVPARLWNTRQGVHSASEWLGFLEVWRQAASLNRLVMQALHHEGLPAIAFQPSAGILAEDGHVARWDLGPLQASLQSGLIPVVFGDAIFDTQRGGTILSTEDLFDYLVRRLRPTRVLMAGIEPGVWADYPDCTNLIDQLAPGDLPAFEYSLQGSSAPDVTGGMASKVRQGLAWVQDLTGLEVLIFSGTNPGAMLTALQGETAGTRLVAAR